MVRKQNTATRRIYLSKVLLITFIILYSSCTGNDEDTLQGDGLSSIIKINDVDHIQCNEESIINYSGTACCISGPIEASETETIVFKYVSNLNNPTFDWNVISGELQLVSGQNTDQATFEVLEGFNGGLVICQGTENRRCSEVIEISLK